MLLDVVVISTGLDSVAYAINFKFLHFSLLCILYITEPHQVGLLFSKLQHFLKKTYSHLEKISPENTLFSSQGLIKYRWYLPLKSNCAILK